MGSVNEGFRAREIWRQCGEQIIVEFLKMWDSSLEWKAWGWQTEEQDEDDVLWFSMMMVEVKKSYDSSWNRHWRRSFISSRRALFSKIFNVFTDQLKLTALEKSKEVQFASSKILLAKWLIKSLPLHVSYPLWNLDLHQGSYKNVRAG